MVYRKIQISIYTGIWQVGQKSRHVVINSKLLSGAAVEYFQMWGDHTVAITLHLNFRAILLSLLEKQPILEVTGKIIN